MNLYKTIALVSATLLLHASCNTKEASFDASGAFEAVETIISAEASGKILSFEIEEGQHLDSGTIVGYIDSSQLALKRQQLEAQINAVLGKKPNIALQVGSLQEQLTTAEYEQKRITKLVQADAATRKQLDDANAQIEVLKRQISAQKSSLNISSDGLSKEALPIALQMAQVADQLDKCCIRNPLSGTVLSKYAEVNEMTAIGKPLYKIADLSSMVLRVYISGKQMPQVKIGQQVIVATDNGNGAYDEAPGRISWISDKAEFTPKTIQTKEERANMVYAVKVRIKNDGRYKIGMYGAIKLK